MLDSKGRFIIKEYGKKSPFASFLPGISGVKGIPLWSFYVNRGQCITCFGVKDKDHSIMQFYPAHQAYQHTNRLGFRTFLKKEGKVIESFANPDIPHQMAVGMNDLTIVEENKEEGLLTTVTYGTLPNETVAGFLRKVTIKNQSKTGMELEIIDGMPAIVPYGINLSTITEMGQTCKAWMEVVGDVRYEPIFKVRASTEDTAKVEEVMGGNYGIAFDEEGEKIPVIVDPQCLFSYDTSYGNPVALHELSLEEILVKDQEVQNNFPCCFFAKKVFLQAGEEVTFYEMYGHTDCLDTLEEQRKKLHNKEYFEMKFAENIALTENLTKKIDTKTANPVFDAYCKQTYLDNVLRGGEPIQIGEGKTYYVYSRKHGDMERDYNYFSMLCESYSEGNSNFRDVNQNRRCDVAFSPYVGTYNIHLFYDALQLDGYNPLGIEKVTFQLEKTMIAQFPCLKEIYQNEGLDFTKSFTPGTLYDALRRCGCENLFEQILSESSQQLKTAFHEGYWTDHWTYNLDLIEEYVRIFPEKEKELLFEDTSFVYRNHERHLLPARKRYVETEQGVRQYRFHNERKIKQEVITDVLGNTIYVTLFEKLLSLAANKVMALDFYGMGIEMEGGKPGWYDALNGLPGLLGSSMAETYELARMLQYMKNKVEYVTGEIRISEELEDILKQIVDAIHLHKDELQHKKEVLHYWESMGRIKEDYHNRMELPLSGKKVDCNIVQITEVIEELLQVVTRGINLACEYGDGICPTYFYYTVLKYESLENGLFIKEVEVEQVPPFLEGPVRYFKYEHKKEKLEKLYRDIKNSHLYDTKLKMYKVNGSLSEASLELGRAKAFTPGWLENESIWLHMEYKYLLELIKNGFYKEFLEDYKTTLIPFLKEEVYGRSLLENSSFIASSAGPNTSIHGKGFVARLSGAAVEFLHMWQLMMFGKQVFFYENEELTLRFQPFIPKELIGEDKTIQAMFVGKVVVTYVCGNKEKDIIPGRYQIVSYEIVQSGDCILIEGDQIGGRFADEIRMGRVDKIIVRIEERMNGND